MMEIKTKIKELRIKNGLTQAALGERLGVSAKVISKWENGESLPHCEQLPRLADAFHIGIDELFGRTYSENVDLKKEVRTYGFDHSAGISDLQKLLSYLILGMQERQNLDMGCYAEQALREISDELERSIQNGDERPQCYAYGTGDSAVNFARDDFAITTIWHCGKETFEEIMQLYAPSMRPLFAFLALDGAGRLLRHLLANPENACFTLESLMKATDTDERTARSFVALLFSLKKTTSETVIEKETAVINGAETEIYSYYPGQVTNMFKTVLLTSYLLMTEKGGFR